MVQTADKSCPFNEKPICDKNCRLYTNAKCTIAIIED